MATAAELPLAERNYFTDHSLLVDPYAYFEALRGEGPIHRAPNGVVFVTGFQESVDILLDTEHFSSFQTQLGPLAPLPFVPEGEDLSDQIAAHRDPNTMSELMVSYDGEQHANARSLLNRLFVPSRLRANEEYMWTFAGELVDDAVARGGCELISEIATPYVTLVIADLLGVPEEDREKFRAVIDAGPPPGSLDDDGYARESHPLMFMAQFFMQYVAERRASPREDVLSMLANANFPDGTQPEALEVVKSAMFLFAAGQDTSAKLLGNAMQRVARDKALQSRLRTDPKQIAAFLEETLRLEGSTKATFRLVKKAVRIGDYQLVPGDRVFVGLAAANRDPARWANPTEFEIGRRKIQEHLGFGRGAHTCLGAPLARVEVRVIFERFFEKTSDISLSDEHLGPDGEVELDYEPSFIIRGLSSLKLKLQPA
ncbi:cytochrome P450 [Novosphingobium chloroacetimidivorans]|uniref:Cytochrome P450 n=1 Tax=Novosphingobium chloroacetimidivorans TaxID=1428314 RepID=A0A7W7NWB7_9SPHN|nr:cytochrome P450 [Novosphingobium chloroacetimidivorans]MBB4859388.1 cytochrome P450 [Novosphingobium chloroacetimidivorans]